MEKGNIEYSGILQGTFLEWLHAGGKAGDPTFYDTPNEAFAKALFRSGRVHTPVYADLYTYEKTYVQRQVNKVYGV